MSIDSIKSRLKSYSVKNNKVHQFTITRFLQERFLYRLSISEYRDYFLLKGGALVYVYGINESRYTKDIDFLLSKIKSNEDDLKGIFKEIIDVNIDDGVAFYRESIFPDSKIKQVTNYKSGEPGSAQT
ncbi:MAG: nucleotidyl transferase AbiEii/AbiGii toxin family protein [Bacteroidota bacterium]